MRITREHLLVAAAVAIFCIWKFCNLHFRFGDENVYFYMTHAVRQGLVPYKDFNLADPPVFIYLLTAFSALIGKHLILFKIWPPLFDAGSALLIYLILKRLGSRFAAMGPILYLFSFTVLSTADYVTGAETAVFCMLLAILLDLRGRPSWSGLAWALACLSKLYIAPALLGYLAYKLFKKEPGILRAIIAGALVGTAVLLPFFLAAPHQTLANLIVHQLHRPAGIDKWQVLGLFAQMEWLLIILGAGGALVTQHQGLVWPLLASLAFLIWFPDLYYLYLHVLLPFLALLAAELLVYLSSLREELAWGLVGFALLVLIYPLASYSSVFAPQSIFEDPQEIASALRAAPGDLPVYGVQEAAPLVALMAGKPIFQNVIDTNTQNFLSGALSEKDISDDAIKHGIYLVARVAEYPGQGISDTGFESYFSKADFAACKRLASFPRPTPDSELNEVAIYACGR